MTMTKNSNEQIEGTQPSVALTDVERKLVDRIGERAAQKKAKPRKGRSVYLGLILTY